MSKQTGGPASFVGATAFSLAGPVAWALHLGVVYATQHVVCIVSPDSMALYRAAFGALTLIFIAALSLATIRRASFLHLLHGNTNDQRVDRFLAETMRWLSVLSIIGIGWTALALLFINACPALR
jgi:hypothetical protein